MNYRCWEDEVPEEIKRDSVWNAKAYRLALFAADLSWHDSTKLVEDKRTISLADQLFRSTGAISADIEAEPLTQTLDQSIDAEEMLNVVPLP